VVNAGGRQDVGSFTYYEVQDGVASGTEVNSGGAQYVSGGNVFSTTISAGGTQLIAGGTGSQTILYGEATVQNGGVARGTRIEAGGVQMIEGSGHAVGTRVESGGQEIVGLQGRDLRSEIYAGGLETVQSGGVTSNATVAGTLVIDTGGTAKGNIAFMSGGTLVLDAGTLSTGTVTAFLAGDTIDLPNVAYSTGDTVTVATAGVVTISAGGVAYDVNVAGATVGETGFLLSADSGTGTKLTTDLSVTTMAFLRPASGGSESAMVPEMAAVAVVKAVAGGGGIASAVEAGGWSRDLLRPADGGLQMMVVSQSVV
jgi:autotransporter passenger strand-loop-strand repeat protein